MAIWTARTAVAGIFFGTAWWVDPVAAKTTEIGPSDDLSAAIAALEPGDELVLSGGEYSLQSKLTISVSGTDRAPIVIRAKEGENAHITRPDAKQNTINIESVEHLELRGLEVSGGSHGIRMRNASFVTIRDCDIHDTADVALSANYSDSAYQGLHIVGNHIHDTGGTGEGMYLGCNSNACQVFDSVIENNWIHHTNASDVTQGDGIEIKEGSYNNIVRHNVIHDTNYPCILTYSTVGNGGPNVIEGNLMWGCGDHAIQSAADAIIENNIILGAKQDGIACQTHQQGSPSNLKLSHNTVIMANNNAIDVNDISGTVVIVNNALYANSGNALRLTGDLGAVVVAGNVGSGATQGVSEGFSDTGDLTTDFVAASYSGAVPNDVFPTADSALTGWADTAHLSAHDFNGTSRTGRGDVGAYAFAAEGNLGWPLQAGFKEMVSEDPPGGGADGGDGADAGGADGGADAGGADGGADAGGADSGQSSTRSDLSSGADPAAGNGCSVSARAPRRHEGFIAWLVVALVMCWSGRRILRSLNGTTDAA